MLVAALAVVVMRNGDRGSDGDGPQDLAAVIADVVVDPDARSVHLAESGGKGSADIVILDGRAYLVRDSLPPLGEDETYQLWGQKGETKVSLGVLGSSPDQAIVAADANYDAMAITAEKKPGVVSSTNPAVVAGLVPVD
jgi:hypothetical protein